MNFFKKYWKENKNELIISSIILFIGGIFISIWNSTIYLPFNFSGFILWFPIPLGLMCIFSLGFYKFLGDKNGN